LLGSFHFTQTLPFFIYFWLRSLHTNAPSLYRLPTSMTVLLGSLAALTSPLLMTIGFVIWDKQWTGSAFALNMFKGSLASIGFLLLSLVTRSSPLSSAVITSSVAGYLIISSIIGILIGDAAWLEALRLLGARRVILVDSLKPFLSAFLGWAILGEELHWAAGIGIVATMVGVTVVSLEKNAAVAEEEEEESDATMKLEVGRAKRSRRCISLALRVQNERFARGRSGAKGRAPDACTERALSELAAR